MDWRITRAVGRLSLHSQAGDIYPNTAKYAQAAGYKLRPEHEMPMLLGGISWGLSLQYGPFEMDFEEVFLEDKIVQLKPMLGTNIWIGSAGQLHAKLGYRRDSLSVISADDIIQHNFAYELSFSNNINEHSALTMALGGSLSGDMVLKFGIEFGYTPTKSVVTAREKAEHALEQAKETIFQIKTLLSATHINQIASEMPGNSPRGSRRLQVLRDVMFYMTLPGFVWERKSTLSFKAFIEKARSEATFAQATTNNENIQKNAKQLMDQINNLPQEITTNLITDLAADALGIMSWFKERAEKTGCSNRSQLYPERTAKTVPTFKEDLGRYRYIVRDLGASSNLAAKILLQLEGLEKKLDVCLAPLDITDPRQIIIKTVREYSEKERDYIFQWMMRDFRNKATNNDDTQIAADIAAEFYQQYPPRLLDKVDIMVSEYEPYSNQLNEKLRVLGEVKARFPMGAGLDETSLVQLVTRIKPKNPSSRADSPFNKFFPAKIIIKKKRHDYTIERRSRSGMDETFYDVFSYLNHIETILLSFSSDTRHEIMAKRNILLILQKEINQVIASIGRTNELDKLITNLQKRHKNSDADLRDCMMKELKSLPADPTGIASFRRDVYLVKNIFPDHEAILDALDAYESKIEGSAP